MTTNAEKIIWAGYSFAQEQVVKQWRIQAYKEMIAKRIKEDAMCHSTST